MSAPIQRKDRIAFQESQNSFDGPSSCNPSAVLKKYQYFFFIHSIYNRMNMKVFVRNYYVLLKNIDSTFHRSIKFNTFLTS